MPGLSGAGEGGSARPGGSICRGGRCPGFLEPRRGDLPGEQQMQIQLLLFLQEQTPFAAIIVVAVDLFDDLNHLQKLIACY